MVKSGRQANLFNWRFEDGLEEGMSKVLQKAGCSLIIVGHSE
jgi:hypothetical protein